MRPGTRGLAVLLLLVFAGTASAEDLGVPAGGLDRVLLGDGRVLDCRVGEETDGRVELVFADFKAVVSAYEILEVRRFRDYDPEPHSEEEKAKVAEGLARWEGKWLPAKRVEAMRAREEAAARRRREDDLAHASFADRRVRETKSFRIESNVREAALDDYALALDALAAEFRKALKLKPPRKEKPLVLIYRGREEYERRYAADPRGDCDETLGYHVSAGGERRVVVLDRRADHGASLRVLLHECTHVLLDASAPDVRLNRWVAEGLADHFGAVPPERGKLSFGAVREDLLLRYTTMIDAGDTVPFGVLFEAGAPGPAAGRVKFGVRHRAEAWCLVRFLLDGSRASRFADYLDRAISGKGGTEYSTVEGSTEHYLDSDQEEALLTRCLRLKDLSRLKEDLVDYAKSLPPPGPVARVRRGELRWFREKNRDGAELDFEAALEQAGDDPAAYAELGRVLVRIAGREAEALDAYRRAIALDPLNPDLRYSITSLLEPDERTRELRIAVMLDSDHPDACFDLGWSIYRERVRRANRVKEPAETGLVREALALVGHAAVLDASGRRFDALGTLHLVLGELEEAAAAAKRAVELDPGFADYRAGYAKVLAVRGDATGAAKQLARVKTASAEEAVDAVAGAVEACLAWEKPKEALAFLDEWHRAAPPATAVEWANWATTAHYAGEKGRAREICDKGRRAFPDDPGLKSAESMLGGG
jgi:tetratricopeptide (TPR) repeat protein